MVVTTIANSHKAHYCYFRVRVIGVRVRGSGVRVRVG